MGIFRPAVEYVEDDEDLDGYPTPLRIALLVAIIAAGAAHYFNLV